MLIYFILCFLIFNIKINCVPNFSMNRRFYLKNRVTSELRTQTVRAYPGQIKRVTVQSIRWYRNYIYLSRKTKKAENPTIILVATV